MPTSNSFAYTDTASVVINDACSKLGFLGEGDTLTAGEFQLAVRSLNRIFKAMTPDDQSNGSWKTWQYQVGFCFLNANTGTYVLSANQGYWANGFAVSSGNGNNSTGVSVIHLDQVNNLVNSVPGGPNVNSAIGYSVGLQLDSGNVQWTTITAVNVAANTINIASPLVSTMNSTSGIAYIVYDDSAQVPYKIQNVVLRDSGGNDTPTREMLPEEYFNLASKAAPGFAGDPVGWYYEPHIVGTAPFGYLKTDVAQAQDTSKYLVINYLREIQDIVNPTDILDVPKEYYRAIVYELAFDLSDDFDIEWDEQKERKRQLAIRQATKGNPKRSSKYFMPGDRGTMFNFGDGFYSR